MNYMIQKVICQKKYPIKSSGKNLNEKDEKHRRQYLKLTAYSILSLAGEGGPRSGGCGLS